LLKAEKERVATVALVAEPFIEDAKLTAKSEGMAGLPLAHLREPLTNLSPDQVKAVVEPSIDQVIKGLTAQVLVKDGSKKEGTREENFEIFRGIDNLSAWESMNRAFLEYGWSDGFPIVPATEPKVEEMLKTTKWNPEEVITILEPGMGQATVRKIAINAVMAGCLPEHLPILIAAVKGLTDPRFSYRLVAMSTGPHTPMMVINGPIRKKIGLNCEGGALGPGAKSHVNTVLGRALRLIMMNIGHTYLGVTDMDTIGSPTKYSMCIGENEEKNPWDTYHVERGYGPDDNTVTLFGVESQIEIWDFKNHTPEGILTTVAGSIASIGSFSARSWIYPERHSDNCMLLCPDHAKVIASHGWGKDDIKQYLYVNANLPARYFKNACELHRTKPGTKWIHDVDDEYLIPITGAYDWFHIVVVGGAAGKSSYTTGVGQAITVKIED
jgi:hypothetical protein